MSLIMIKVCLKSPYFVEPQAKPDPKKHSLCTNFHHLQSFFLFFFFSTNPPHIWHPLVPVVIIMESCESDTKAEADDPRLQAAAGFSEKKM